MYTFLGERGSCIYIKPIDNFLKNLGKHIHASMPADMHYSDHQTSVRLLSQTNPEAKNAGPILLKNLLFTVRTLYSSLFFRTIWVLPGSVSDLQILRHINKSLSFISISSLLTFVLSRHTYLNFFSTGI